MTTDKNQDANEPNPKTPDQDIQKDKQGTPQEQVQKNSKAQEIIDDEAMLESIEKEIKQDIADIPAELKTQLEALNGKYLRLMAEFDNYKRRTARDYERMVGSANEKLLLQMIEVRENFDRALIAQTKAPDATTFVDGVKLIYTKFETILKSSGLETFGAIGDEFDPEHHDGLMRQPSETIAENHIAGVFEPGYTLNGRIVKHAKVIVSAGGAEAVVGDSPEVSETDSAEKS